MSSQIATFATIFFSMILVNNYVLVQFLGICPFLGVSKKLDSSAGMGAAVIVVMVIATAVTFPLQIFLLDAYNLGYLQTIIFILVIAVLVQLIEITLKKYVPTLYQSRLPAADHDQLLRTGRHHPGCAGLLRCCGRVRLRPGLR